MKYSYRGYFYVDEANRSCIVSVPSLCAEFTVEPEPFTYETVVESARRELELTAYMWLQENNELPDDWTGDSKGYSFEAELEGDTDEAAKRIISIKEFDLS